MKMKRILIATMALLIFVTATPVSANNIISMDSYLSSLGVPQLVLNNMSHYQKLMIYDTVSSEAEFTSYREQGYMHLDYERDIQIRGSIPNSDLTLSVTAFKVIEGGEEVYYIYPSFVWNTLTNISNDVYGMALYPGWEVIPGQENLRVYISNLNGQLVQYTDVDPQTSSYSGYAYVMSDIGMMNLRHEGHAYIHAKDKSGNSTHAISLNYAHDTSVAGVSYSISIGPASVSISSNSNSVDYMSSNYYFY